MSANFIAKSSVIIDAPARDVWGVLTSEEGVKRYLFGAQVETDWKPGSEITWQGSFEGREFRDRGTILQILPEKLFQHTYHSSLSQLPDQPENYFNVTYELNEEGDQTHLTLTTSNLPDEESTRHVEKNWESVLARLKEVVEAKNSSNKSGVKATLTSGL